MQNSLRLRAALRKEFFIGTSNITNSSELEYCFKENPSLTEHVGIFLKVICTSMQVLRRYVHTYYVYFLPTLHLTLNTPCSNNISRTRISYASRED